MGEDSLTPPRPAAGPEFQIVSRIIELLDPLSASDRQHVLQTITTWFRIGNGLDRTLSVAAPSPSGAQRLQADDEKFANRAVQSAKDFLFEKEPANEAERVACLAYYLTHFMDVAHFKNLDISNLNTAAAQRKLSNPGVAVSNAMRDGYL